MKYILNALRYTYHTERKAYPGLNDLINMLDGELVNTPHLIDASEVINLLLDIDDSLHDINQDVLEPPIQENKETVYLFLIDDVKVLCSNAHAYESAKDGCTVLRCTMIKGDQEWTVM